MIRIIVADDHDMVREGIRSWLEMAPDLEVIGEARNGAEALEMVRRLEPDVLLQDIQMPGIDGLAVIEAIGREGLPTRVLAITGFDSKTARAAIEKGACGYLSKEERREVIIEAVRWAAENRRGVWLSPAVAEEIERVRMAVESAALTPAELNVLRHIELSNADISRQLHISESTVKNHISSIYSKLGINSRRHAVRWAEQHGLIG